MVFDVSDNQLDGNIPSYPGIIQQFDISNNRFQGNVPSSIFSNQSQISLFDASSNQLEGLVSFSIFANSSSLDYLDLSSNHELEVETESPSWIPTFQLTTLNLARCNLNKKNGHVVPSFISTQINLQYLDLSYNSLEGGIPCQLFFNTNTTELYLRSNKIEGSFLDCFIHGTLNLEKFDISDNHVKGPLPENFGSLFSSLSHVDMSSNELEGKIPSSFGSMSLEILDLSNNKLSGTIPRSLTGNDSTPLVYLNLSNNTLQGEMLPRDSNMTKLECLYLSGNQFEGIISPAISNSPLVILDVRGNYLSGNIPKWLYDHPHLVAVLLSGNHLEGHLTQRLCRMQRLQVFDVSRNRLSGGIPSCLDNVTFWKKSSPSSTNSNYFTQKGRLYYLLTQSNSSDYGLSFVSMFRIKDKVYTFKGVPLLLMTGIDLSSNHFTGGIPTEMGELSQLRSLNLSHNSLTGSIPISFQNLTNVENLDLSHNKLRGKIPSELVVLTSLSAFSVAYNNLSGRIPFERQFSTFEMRCYDGNPELCGDPLPGKCSSTNQPKDEKERNRIIDHPLFFYAFVTVSYAFGFWAFFGILIINKNWRQKYFRAVDRYIESFLEYLSK
ncbi:receptor like protein 21-like [Juglans microcarpa x Juglans regia]|uniref:receptor like protein 21-like n=1 Tax=Juglans microcarpa x Juglans regia TaxID=2249226 RepID=UPI001B7EC6FE|nr:receptor like protein 21-like [Juglans microcarpa x Juglans regia]